MQEEEHSNEDESFEEILRFMCGTFRSFPTKANGLHWTSVGQTMPFVIYGASLKPKPEKYLAGYLKTSCVIVLIVLSEV